MASGDPESGEGADGVEEYDEDPYQGGSEAAGVQIFLQSRHPVDVFLWYGDVCSYPSHRTDDGDFTGSCGTATDKASPMAAGILEAGAQFGGGGERGGGI